MDIEITVDKWWGSKSVILTDTCLLSVFKAKLISDLARFGVGDIDARNKVPHIQVCSESNPKDQVEFDRINGKIIALNERSLKIERNLVSIDNEAFHFTVLYKRDIISYRSQILEIYKTWLNSL